MNLKHILVAPGTVHKNTPHDVFICNPRRGIPFLFPSHKLSLLNKKEKEFILQFYSLNSKNEYTLDSVPLEINGAAVNALPSIDRFYLEQFYVFQNGTYIFIGKEISENDELNILKRFGLKDKKFSSLTRFHISTLISKMKTNTSKWYYFDLYNYENHNYYYNEDHEQIPGTLLIEAATQAVYAYLHEFIKIKKEEVTITLLSCNSSFHNSMCSNLPVKIRLENITSFAEDHSKKKIEKMFFKIDMCQGLDLCCEFTLNIIAIDLKIYKQMSSTLNRIKNLRFTPRNKFSSHGILYPEKKEYMGIIKNVSLTGFCMTLKDYDLKKEKGRFKFNIQTIGELRGTYSVQWFQKEEDELTVGFSIDNMTEDNKSLLYEAIKQHSFLVPKRDFY